jgi:TraB/PrgY/gumN family
VQSCIAQVEKGKHRSRQDVFARLAAGVDPLGRSEREGLHGPHGSRQPGRNIGSTSPMCGSSSGSAACASSEAELETTPQPAPSVTAPLVASFSDALASLTYMARRWLGASRTGDVAAAAPLDTFERWCRRGAQHMHSFDLAEHSSSLPVHSAALGPTEDEAAEPHQRSAYYRTTVHERDQILAQRLWEVVRATEGRSVVAVVGANHLPGIAQHWREAQSEVAAQRCVEYLQPPDAAGDAAWHAVRWKARAIERLALGFEVGVAAGAGATAILTARAWLPPRWRWAPLAALSGLAATSAGLTVSRQNRAAHLVHNLAVHQDMRTQVVA